MLKYNRSRTGSPRDAMAMACSSTLSAVSKSFNVIVAAPRLFNASTHSPLLWEEEDAQGEPFSFAWRSNAGMYGSLEKGLPTPLRYSSSSSFPVMASPLLIAIAAMLRRGSAYVWLLVSQAWL